MKLAFTLTEILISIVIIGVVAAITIPSLQSTLENQHYKVAYKKALSDLRRATLMSVAFREFPYRESKRDTETTAQEWAQIKKNIIATKVCENNNLYDCWVNADRIWGGPSHVSWAFVDNSGRAWAVFSQTENIYFVDTNGDRKPNKFGKDRWAFKLADENGVRICNTGDICNNLGYPAQIQPYKNQDYLTKDSNYCNYPPCYYASWLY